MKKKKLREKKISESVRLRETYLFLPYPIGVYQRMKRVFLKKIIKYRTLFLVASRFAEQLNEYCCPSVRMNVRMNPDVM